jgi:hypothetical protein
LKPPSEVRRARASFALSDANGEAVASGDAEAVIEAAGLTVGPVSVSFLDVDGVAAGDYRVQLQLWPDGALLLSQLGRRFETFVAELRRARNQTRVAGLLAHGVSAPETFAGAVTAGGATRSAELQVYDTHVTLVPEDGDPWQVALGGVTAVVEQRDPPGLVLEARSGATTVGQLGRWREACHAAVAGRREAQGKLLFELTGSDYYADGRGVARDDPDAFARLLDRFTAGARQASRDVLLAAASGEPRFGLVQLLDPAGDELEAPSPLPAHWAAFLLVPVGAATVFELLAGPSAATYVFRGEPDAVNDDLQLLHFRRAPLALTAEQAVVTPANPHRLALRKLEPLRRLRAITAARVVHDERWASSLDAGLASFR